MSWYAFLKQLHILTACVTAVLFVLRLTLDAAKRPGWRSTPLRWLPHLNDTVLLSAALGLVVTTGWMPFVHHWLTAKVSLLVGYVVAGSFAIKPKYSTVVRTTAAVFALLQLALIFWLALNKPTI